jgi:hypothetical protein
MTGTLTVHDVVAADRVAMIDRWCESAAWSAVRAEIRALA